LKIINKFEGRVEGVVRIMQKTGNIIWDFSVRDDTNSFWVSFG